MGYSDRILGSYRFEPAGDQPVLSLAPLCTRMVAAHRDRVGTIHLFTDAYDPKRETAFEDARFVGGGDSLSHHQRSRNWDHGFALKKGRWRGDAARSDPDCVGVGVRV